MVENTLPVGSSLALRLPSPAPAAGGSWTIPRLAVHGGLHVVDDAGASAAGRHSTGVGSGTTASLPFPPVLGPGVGDRLHCMFVTRRVRHRRAE